MNSIKWKGTDSSTVNGLIILNLPPISLPPIRYNEVEIDGKDGSIIDVLGYGAYNKAITIGLKGNYDINAVINFLIGEGDLVLSNEPDKVYKAQMVSQIDFNRLVRFRTATVNFRVQPYKYKLNEASVTSTTGTATVSNIGSVPSKPIITLEGSGTVELKVNNVSAFTYTFPTNETSVTIDAEQEEAYSGTVLKNRNMNGEFPRLTVGSNSITTTGTVTSLQIEPNSKWI